MIGLFFEDVVDGVEVDLGSHVFTADSIRHYSERFVPVGFHMNEKEAERGLFSAVVAAGFHICCGWMICFVATNTKARERLVHLGKAVPEIGPSPGLSNVRWPHPVYPGDRISYRLTVTGRRELASKPRWGMVSFATQGHNQQGVQVMSFDGNVLVARHRNQ
jgi:acyl dehydratase